MSLNWLSLNNSINSWSRLLSDKLIDKSIIGQEEAVKKVVNAIIKKVGLGRATFGKLNYRDLENMELYANINKAKKILNWSPKYNLNESLDKVINWYKNNG